MACQRWQVSESQSHRCASHRRASHRCARAGSGPSVPWTDGKKVEVVHSKWSSMAEYSAALQAASVVAAVTNYTADRSRLPNGGYGTLGVCNDSVAVVQAALGAQVTMFPCILAGSSKRALQLTYQVRPASFSRHKCAEVTRRSAGLQYERVETRRVLVTKGAGHKVWWAHKVCWKSAPCKFLNSRTIVCKK